MIRKSGSAGAKKVVFLGARPEGSPSTEPREGSALVAQPRWKTPCCYLFCKHFLSPKAFTGQSREGRNRCCASRRAAGRPADNIHPQEQEGGVRAGASSLLNWGLL